MRKTVRIVVVTATLLSAAAIAPLLIAQETVAVTVDPDKCPELIEASERAAEAYRRGALDASEQIEAGGPLEDDACIGDLRDFDFDFFSGFSTLKGAAIKALKDKAIDALTSMTCDAVQSAADSAQTLLTCNASAGVSLNMSAGFDDLNASECLGQGSLDYDYDAGTYGNGNSGYSAGFNDEVIANPGGGSGGGTTTSGWSGWLDD